MTAIHENYVEVFDDLHYFYVINLYWALLQIYFWQFPPSALYLLSDTYNYQSILIPISQHL